MGQGRNSRTGLLYLPRRPSEEGGTAPVGVSAAACRGWKGSPRVAFNDSAAKPYVRLGRKELAPLNPGPPPPVSHRDARARRGAEGGSDSSPLTLWRLGRPSRGLLVDHQAEAERAWSSGPFFPPRRLVTEKDTVIYCHEGKRLHPFSPTYSSILIQNKSFRAGLVPSKRPCFQIFPEEWTVPALAEGCATFSRNGAIVLCAEPGARCLCTRVTQPWPGFFAGCTRVPRPRLQSEGCFS